jgi:hypothetical protein
MFHLSPVEELDCEMPCNNPLRAYRANGGGITFSKNQGFKDMPLDIPCGQCMACRKQKRIEWGVRILNETKMHDKSCFITLTYDNISIPEGETLVKDDLQTFLKSLRSSLEPERIRYFAVGEYGSQTYRPHYHAVIYNYWPDDAKLWKQLETGPMWKSEKLQKKWGHGIVGINSMSFDLAQYLAKYVTKKITGDMAEKHYGDRLPEFTLMSRRPGIGASYYEKYKKEIWSTDSVPVGGGRSLRPPMYYYRKLKEENPDLHFKIAKKRLENVVDNDPHRQWLKDEYLQKIDKFYEKLHGVKI